jgi:mono/diheme cytochrome c family protein
MLQRLLVERIEHRIIVGTVAFLAIMVLVGWIAINEGARMQAFERQYAGRSVERGAALYMTYCSTCHQVDGRGAVGRAPALNSPHLFGHDFLAEQRSEITALRRN